ncbi:MAG: anti-sigma factor antagonist [Acidobacteria bacterium]|nr:anti-sigma factor antagonist [Acidobacteriota bacterium]
MQLHERRESGVIILAPEGRLDSGKIGEFDKVIQQRIRSGHHHLLIDCTNVVFAASSALRILLVNVRKLNEIGGRLALCNMNPHVFDIFETAGFTKLMNIRDTFEEGLAEVRPAQADNGPEAPPAEEPPRQAGTATSETARAREAAPRTVFAGIWLRAAAAMIDAVMLLVAAVLLNTARNLAGIGSGWGEETVLGLLAVLVWLYFAGMEGSGGATFGKQALQLRVAGNDGKRIGFARASVRHFGKFLSVLTAGIGFLMIGITERKQGLHDKIASCVVIARR